jgi:hypothetical protein
MLGHGQRIAVALIRAVPHSAFRATEQAAAAAAFAGAAIAAVNANAFVVVLKYPEIHVVHRDR